MNGTSHPKSQHARFTTPPILPPHAPKDPPDFNAWEGILAAAPTSVEVAEVNRKRARWSEDLKYIAPNKDRLEEPIQKQYKVIRTATPSAYIYQERLPDPNAYTPVGHYDAHLEGVPDAAEGIDVLLKTIGNILYEERW